MKKDNRVAEIISRGRQNRNMTQEELASRLGVTPQAVSKWECGTGMPDVSLLPGICSVLKISGNAFLGTEENLVENGNPKMEQEIRNVMFAEPLVLQFGMDLVPCFVEGVPTNYVNKCRMRLVAATGMLMPILRLRDHSLLEPLEYQILSYDKVLFQGKVEAVNEQVFQMLIDKTVEICSENYDTILNKQIVKTMVDNMKALYPGVAEGLIPERISYIELLQYLRKKVRETHNIHDMIHIFEELESRHLDSNAD